MFELMCGIGRRSGGGWVEGRPEPVKEEGIEDLEYDVHGDRGGRSGLQ